MGDCELAWAAGFFDGEGYAGTVTVGRVPRFSVSVTQYERTTLERFQAAVWGLGRIYSRSVPAPSGRVRSSWSAQRFEHSQAVAALLWRWLSPPKRQQIAAALSDFHLRHRLIPGRVLLRCTVCGRLLSQRAESFCCREAVP